MFHSNKLLNGEFTDPLAQDLRDIQSWIDRYERPVLSLEKLATTALDIFLNRWDREEGNLLHKNTIYVETRNNVGADW